MILTDANLWVAVHDDRDVWHTESLRFFEDVLRKETELHAPTLLLAEVACSAARRSRSGPVGVAVAEKIKSYPHLRLWQMDDSLLERAILCGSRCFLRGADALYAATAEQTGSQLVTWDGELAERAGGMTPTAWLAANP